MGRNIKRNTKRTTEKSDNTRVSVKPIITKQLDNKYSDEELKLAELVGFDVVNELRRKNSQQFKQDNRTPSLRVKAQEDFKEEKRKVEDAKNLNRYNRIVGNEEINPETITRKQLDDLHREKGVKAGATVLTSLALPELLPNVLEATTLSNYSPYGIWGDAVLASTFTAEPLTDMITNGPSVTNVSNAALGLFPMVGEAYKMARPFLSSVDFRYGWRPYVKVYKGGDSYNTPYNFSGHGTDSLEVASLFGKPVVGYIRRPKSEIIDLVPDNNWNVISTNFTPAFTSSRLDDFKRFKIYTDAGGKFSIEPIDELAAKIIHHNNFTINPRKAFFGELSPIHEIQADRIVKEASLLPYSITQGFSDKAAEERAIALHEKLEAILDRTKKFPIKYKNVVELGDGWSYIFPKEYFHTQGWNLPEAVDIKPSFTTVYTGIKNITKPNLTTLELKGVPKGERNQPLNDDKAVEMFKEYGSLEIPRDWSNLNIYMKQGGKMNIDFSNLFTKFKPVQLIKKQNDLIDDEDLEDDELDYELDNDSYISHNKFTFDEFFKFYKNLNNNE